MFIIQFPSFSIILKIRWNGWEKARERERKKFSHVHRCVSARNLHTQNLSLGKSSLGKRACGKIIFFFNFSSALLFPLFCVLLFSFTRTVCKVCGKNNLLGYGRINFLREKNEWNFSHSRHVMEFSLLFPFRVATVGSFFNEQYFFALHQGGDCGWRVRGNLLNFKPQ